MGLYLFYLYSKSLDLLKATEFLNLLEAQRFVFTKIPSFQIYNKPRGYKIQRVYIYLLSQGFIFTKSHRVLKLTKSLHKNLTLIVPMV